MNTFAHAQPFTEAEPADFEQAVLACANPNVIIAELAKTSLGALVKHHGKAKCDLLMHALDARHGTEDTRQ
ncbi:hypothetical protein [Bradyrhizobium sp. 187]|uniref:hypothetical protein n=1 Tax=Bradyrhizobium sp. 187 TaxID=2782655 RepID=UPI0020000CDC|nr:hypothetical protein [Bradyrhizobium sp. 187]UPJ71896.1 hypothetical protein IVB19_30590 [Bradyrhizobium sp. 187]